jgi:hypothetical protein
MSKASTIAQTLATIIGTIRTANGYATDIGAQVFRGKRKLDESDPPCSTIFEGEDMEQAQQGPAVRLRQRYVVEGVSTCDPDNPNDAAHAIIADIKKAVWRNDEPFGVGVEVRYAGRSIGTREVGSTLIAAAIELEIVFAENLANP